MYFVLVFFDKYGSLAHLKGDDSDYLGRLLAYPLSILIVRYFKGYIKTFC